MVYLNKNYITMALIALISGLLLIIFVRKPQIRKAFYAFLVAQLFSWPITILYVKYGLQVNPVRLFPHATESNFLFAFIFHPTFFTIYYLHYPIGAHYLKGIFFTATIVAVPLLTHLIVETFTDLIYYPNNLIILASFLFVFTIYNISRIYIDRYFDKLDVFKKQWGHI